MYRQTKNREVGEERKREVGRVEILNKCRVDGYVGDYTPEPWSPGGERP